MERQWDLRRPPGPRRAESWQDRLPDVVRDPIRLALLVGAVLVVVGSLLDWIEAWLPYREWFSISGFAHAGDGAITLVLGFGLVALAMSERAAESRAAPLAAGPFALGVVALLLLRIAMQDAQIYLDSIRPNGGHGYLLPGFWITVAGAAATTLVGALRLWNARHEVRLGIALRPRAVASILGGLAGAALGYFGAVEIGQGLLAGAMGGTLASVMILLAIIGTFLGAWIGARLAATIVASLGS